jgi:hypothetical protein
MSAKAVATEIQIRRAIKAARKEGLSIAGVRADGTVIIGEPSPALVPLNDANAKWADMSNWTVKKKEGDQ